MSESSAPATPEQRQRWQPHVTRVRAELFGDGTFVEWLFRNDTGIARVRWDETPPRDYCSCQNPCVVLAEWLVELEG